MLLKPPKRGLNPGNYIGKKETMKIVAYPDSTDCLKMEEKTSNDGKVKYNQFSLCVLWENVQKELAYLMEGQLSDLNEQFGQNTLDWIGQMIEVSAIKNGNYTNWVLTPTPQTIKQEEDVN